MNPFYKLNKTLDGIRNEPTQEQKALVESRAPKSPAKQTLEQALRTDLRSLMEDGSAGLAGGNTLEEYFNFDKPKKGGQGNPSKDKLANRGGMSTPTGDPAGYKDMVKGKGAYGAQAKKMYGINGPKGKLPESTLEEAEKSLSKAATTVKKGALHKQEGIPQDKKIGDKKLNNLKKSGTPLEKKRANFALNIQGKGKKKVKENMGMEECGMGGMEEGATPDEITQQKIKQMKRAAATRKNSRAVQQQPAQGGPRRSEVPAFIRKGRGDPGLDHNDLEETSMYSESDKDILDYLKSKLVPTGGNAKATSRPYNGSASASNAYNGMEFEEADDDTSTSSAGGTVYTRKLDPRTGYPTGSDTGMPSKVPSKNSKGSVPKKSGKKEMDECCPHCGQTMGGGNSPMLGNGREVDMEDAKAGMGHFVKAAKKVGGVAKVLAKRDYDGDGKKETSKAEHAGVVDKAIKANKAKPTTKSTAKPATKSTAKPAKKTEEGKGDGNLANNAKPYDKVTQGDVVAGRLGKDEEGGKKKAKKEEKVEETTTSGSVSTSSGGKSSGGMGIGQGIYDSWERNYANLLKEDVNVTTNSSKNDSGEEEEHITIDVSGDDVARIKEMLHSMGVGSGEETGHEHGGEEPCDSCGGVPCQCDETMGEEMGDEMSMEESPLEEEQLDEFLPVLAAIGGRMAAGAAARAGAGAMGQGAANLAGQVGVNAIADKFTNNDDQQTTEAVATYSDNEPDYPSNQEYSNNVDPIGSDMHEPKSTGQATLPVVASQMHRLHSHVSEGQHMMDLYRSIQAIENKEA